MYRGKIVNKKVNWVDYHTIIIDKKRESIKEIDRGLKDKQLELDNYTKSKNLILNETLDRYKKISNHGKSKKRR